MSASSHVKRWITALILLPFLIWSLAVGGWAILVWVLAGAVLGLVEFSAMFRAPRAGLLWVALAAISGAAMLLASWFLGPWRALLALVAAFWLGAMAFLFAFGLGRSDERKEQLFREPLILAAGLLYLPACLQFYLGFNSWEIVFVLLCVFMSDTGAYYAGSLVGGPKLWPAVSPKKTWAGSAGGMLLCLVMALIFGLIFGHKAWPGPDGGSSATWWQWLVMAAALNVTAQLGDLFESALKRSLGVKDSGRLLPGHGGILDRMDSLIPAAPAYAALKAALLGLAASALS